MDVMEEMIGQERRPGMRQMTVAGMSAARPGGYAPRAEKGDSPSERSARGTVPIFGGDEGRRTRDGVEDGRRSMWVECRECEHRDRVRSMNRAELIRVIDSGELRCTECGGRMVEG